MPKKTEGPTREEIAHRAYEISLTSEAGTDEENWHRAERELLDRKGSAPKASAKAPASRRDEGSCNK